jgi:DNA-binding NarL/FixJ family response regulator
VAKIRLMLVDDHTVVRAGLRALFDRQDDMEVVAEAGSAAEVLDRATSAAPELIVLDLTLPGGGGMGLIERLLARDPPPRVLVLTMHDDPAYARAALAAGATGYVVKTVGERDLLTAIRAARHGQVFVDLDAEAKTAAVFGPAASRKAVPTVKLSERELEVLALLGRGHSSLEVADRLDLSPKTVATYKARIAEKLGLKTTADYVKYAADTGLTGPSDSPT